MNIDITAQLRADIRRTDWDRLHVVGDRRQPFMLGEGRERRCGEARITIRSETHS
jgi:hypothetical protein